jgi:hypothetical protein
MKANPAKLVATEIKKEIFSTTGENKLLLIALIFNIPFYWFVPYVSQAITVVLLILYLKRKQQNNLNIQTLILTLVTMIIQLPFFWLPFATQIATLIFVGMIFVVSMPQKKINS